MTGFTALAVLLPLLLSKILNMLMLWSGLFCNDCYLQHDSNTTKDRYRHVHFSRSKNCYQQIKFYRLFFSILLSCMRGCFGQSEFHVPSIRAENIRKCSQWHQCHVHDAFWVAALMQKKRQGKQTVYEPWMYKCKSHPISIMYKHEMVSKSRRFTVYAY